jgi:hypothetical protein
MTFVFHHLQVSTLSEAMKLLFACNAEGIGPPTTLHVKPANTPAGVRITVVRHWLRRTKHACDPFLTTEAPLGRLLQLTREPCDAMTRGSGFVPFATAGTSPQRLLQKMLMLPHHHTCVYHEHLGSLLYPDEFTHYLSETLCMTCPCTIDPCTRSCKLQHAGCVHCQEGSNPGKRHVGLETSAAHFK